MASIHGRKLSATDRLTLAYIAAVALVTVVWHPEPTPLVVRSAALAATIVLAAELATVSAAGRILHDFLPIVSMACLFNLTGPAISATDRAHWDPILADVDRRLFGPLPSAWFGLLDRPWWLTDAASIAYVSYYVVPVAMALALYVADRRADFDHLVFTVVATLLVTYACYFAIPASGPRVPQADEVRVLGGSGVSAAVRAFLRAAEGNLLDAFPSGHTTVSLVYLACGWPLLSRWRVPLVLAVGGIVFSTVYLSLHYVIDVVAGVLLALAMPSVLTLLRAWTTPAPAPARQRPSSSAPHPLPSQPIRSKRPLR